MPAPKGHAPYPGCEKGGRPKIYDEKRILEEAQFLYEWLKADENNIFIEDFCLSRKYSRQRVSEWVKVNEEFADAYHLLMTKQLLKLIIGGLYRKYCFPMCALLLTTNHGFRKRNEIKVTSDSSLASLIAKITGETNDILDE